MGTILQIRGLSVRQEFYIAIIVAEYIQECVICGGNVHFGLFVQAFNSSGVYIEGWLYKA